MICTATIKVKETGKLFDLLKDHEDESDRSSISVKKEKGFITISIDSKDATALRASFNSLSKLLAAYEKISSVTAK